MLLGVQRVWGNEPSHSQVNSHVGSWSPKWTPKFSKRNCKGQNSLHWRVFNIIEKLLKRRCLKWAHIAHLDICNTSYGQKKGHESNWSFDFWPLKVRKWPNFMACRQCATYSWKALNEGYNFAWSLIAIGGLHKKLSIFKVAGVPTMGISRLPLGSPEPKSHLDVLPWRATKYNIRGKMVISNKSGPWWVLCVRVACGES
jgi:hypothetical protein